MSRLGLGVVCLLLLAGCNLGASPRETPAPLNPTITPLAQPSGRPAVTILSPAAGTEIEVNQQAIISVSATDGTGITQVQMLVNGAIVKTVRSQSIGGDKTFPALLDYTPRTTGTLEIEVVAFRGQTTSDPATLTLEAVRDTLNGGTSGGGTTGGGGTSGGGSTVVIPPDGVCRVLTDVNVNMRLTPINGGVMTIIPGGTLAVVVARLGDNSWWKVSFNNQQGWVSGQFVDLSGNCANIPIESPNAPATPTLAPTLTTAPRPTNTSPVVATPTSVTTRPDLIITNIGGEQNPTLSGGSSTQTYSVTVSNMGSGSAGQFTVTLRVNDTLEEEWAVGGLAAGQSVLLTTNVTFNASGTAILRVDADTTTAITETSEVNNTGFYTVTVRS